MSPLPRRLVTPCAAVLATILLGAALAACAARSFDPSEPCTTDGRAAGAYPALEALVPRELDGKPPTTVDSGRSCTPTSLGSLAGRGVKELRYAGATWQTGADGGVSMAVFEAPDLRADWVAEFYRLGAQTGRNTESVESTPTTVDGAPAFRVDALNGESYQTVIDWQDGPRVRVVLVASFIREVVTKEQHEQAVRAALAAATSD